ncbi:Magnesium-protoporphyrin O-methyltransferase [bacterium HR17]|uniref:Magnesium-protoporphyrin O-methyltransferase n=1 Tax=Candidatus Fervidibacter japonicus TaxID=2035412 RepID=A0A2H5XG37_9BACT|nr:Magnesium-protoporphyrin O-methyltransferase [bacterium HR17]
MEERFRKLFGDMPVTEAPEFTLLPCCYDTLMRDVPYRMWVSYIADVLRRLDAGFRYRRVLELACGTGTIALEFARRGCQVVGVDISEGMVKIARKKAQHMGLTKRTHFVAQDITQLTLPDEPPFDLALCLFDSLNYITEPARLAQVFARTFTHVRPHGYFVFDLNSEFALREHLFDQDNLDEAEAETPLYYFWRSHYDPQTRLCRVDMWFAVRDARGDWQRFKEVHWQRAYTIDEIRQMAENAGWQCVKVLDAYTYQPPHPKSERWYFVLRKNL